MIEENYKFFVVLNPKPGKAYLYYCCALCSA